MDTVKIKQNAKKITKEKFGELWLGLGINLAISLIYSIVFTYVFKDNTSAMVSLCSLAYSLITYPFTMGLNKYLLMISRKEKPTMKDLFYYYKNNIIETIVLSMLISIALSIGLVLFIIPGVILYIMFAMAQNYFVDGIINPVEAISESTKLMKGYKMDYLNFLISFLGWLLLGVITFGIAYIWVLPYFMISQKLYYLELIKIKKDK